jgi:ketosteroid isomerase-like protein
MCLNKFFTPVVTLLVLLLTNNGAAQTKASGDCDGVVTSEEALKAEDARYKALLDGDLSTLEKMFGEDLYYSHSDGALNTKRIFLDNLKKNPSKYISFTRHDATVKTYGCVAVISGDMTITTNPGPGKEPHASYLRFTTIWAKRAKGLEFVHWQSTPLKEKEEKEVKK